MSYTGNHGKVISEQTWQKKKKKRNLLWSDCQMHADETAKSAHAMLSRNNISFSSTSAKQQTALSFTDDISKASDKNSIYGVTGKGGG